MPKSRQSQRRHMARSKRKAGKQSHPMAVEQQQMVASAQATVHPQAPAHIVNVRTPKSAAAAAGPSINITSELRRIGILTAIILVILVVLARILA